MTGERQYLPLPSIENVMPVLNKISILAGLSEEQLRLVFRSMESTSCRAGENVFEQGGMPSHLYVVLSGRVRIVVDVDGDPMELVEFGVGACFGEASIIAIEPHAATAVAMQDTDLIMLSRMALLDLYHQDARLFGMLILNIAREACRRLHKTDQILFHYTQKR